MIQFDPVGGPRKKKKPPNKDLGISGNCSTALTSCLDMELPVVCSLSSRVATQLWADTSIPPRIPHASAICLDLAPFLSILYSRDQCYHLFAVDVVGKRVAIELTLKLFFYFFLLVDFGLPSQ